MRHLSSFRVLRIIGFQFFQGSSDYRLSVLSGFFGFSAFLSKTHGAFAIYVARPLIRLNVPLQWLGASRILPTHNASPHFSSSTKRLVSLEGSLRDVEIPPEYDRSIQNTDLATVH